MLSNSTNIFDENVVQSMTPSHNRSRSVGGISSIKQGKTFGTPGAVNTPRRFGNNLTNTPGNKSAGKMGFGNASKSSKVRYMMGLRYVNYCLNED